MMRAFVAVATMCLLSCKPQAQIIVQKDASIAPSAATHESERVVLDIAALPTACSRVATWPVLDFRRETRDISRVDGAPVAENDVVEVDPSDYVRVRGRELRAAWHFLPEDLLPPKPAPRVLDLRLIKFVARSVSVILNGRAVGRIVFGKQPPKTFSLTLPEGILVPGRNELVLRAGSKLKAGEVAFGADDVRLREGNAAVPGAEGAASSHAVAGFAVHGISLKPGSAVRCYATLPKRSTVRFSLGQQGPGDAAIELWAAEDRAPAELIARAAASKEGVPATEVSFALPDRTEGPVPRSLELRAVSTAQQGRLVIGSARVMAEDTAPPIKQEPAAKSVVVVVWGSLSKASLAMYGGRGPSTPVLDSLAARGVNVEHMRASSTYSQGAMGAVLTGQSPFRHRAKDGRSLLSESLPTLPEAVRQAGVRTAYFTGNPTTTRLLGFGRGWDVIEEALPGGPIPATRLYERAANFIRSHANERWLIVIHARGGHPPWDADAAELSAMPPKDYSGAIDPRSAGEWLEQIRRGHRPNRYTDADRTRVSALYDLSLTHHDAALGTLVDAVRETGNEARTAWLIVGDVPPNEGLPLPFGEGEFPDEPQLEVPMIVASVRRADLRGARTNWQAESEDVASLVVGELGLAAPRSFDGIDLLAATSSESRLSTRVRVATSDATSTIRVADRVLQAKGTTPGRLCDLGLEPTCVTDVRVTYPVSAATLEFLAAPWLTLAKDAATHPVTIEASEAAARAAWGLP